MDKRKKFTIARFYTSEDSWSDFYVVVESKDDANLSLDDLTSSRNIKRITSTVNPRGIKGLAQVVTNPAFGTNIPGGSLITTIPSPVAALGYPGVYMPITGKELHDFISGYYSAQEEWEKTKWRDFYFSENIL